MKCESASRTVLSIACVVFLLRCEIGGRTAEAGGAALPEQITRPLAEADVPVVLEQAIRNRDVLLVDRIAWLSTNLAAVKRAEAFLGTLRKGFQQKLMGYLKANPDKGNMSIEEFIQNPDDVLAIYVFASTMYRFHCMCARDSDRLRESVIPGLASSSVSRGQTSLERSKERKAQAKKFLAEKERYQGWLELLEGSRNSAVAARARTLRGVLVSDEMHRWAKEGRGLPSRLEAPEQHTDLAGNLFELDAVVETSPDSAEATRAKKIIDEKVQAYQKTHAPIPIGQDSSVTIPRGRRAVGRVTGSVASVLDNLKHDVKDVTAPAGVIVQPVCFNGTKNAFVNMLIDYEFTYSILATHEAPIGNHEVALALKVALPFGDELEEKRISTRVTIAAGRPPTPEEVYLSYILAKRELVSGLTVLRESLQCLSRMNPASNLDGAQALLRQAQQKQSQARKSIGHAELEIVALRSLTKCPDRQVSDAARRCIAAYGVFKKAKESEVKMPHLDMGKWFTESGRPSHEQDKAPSRASAPAEPAKRGKALLPPFTRPLNGRNEVRVRNPNDFTVWVGVRSGRSGRDFSVGANNVASVFLPDGKYDIFFVYSSKPDALFQGDSFTLARHGVEIRIVKVVGGNYDIRRVK